MSVLDAHGLTLAPVSGEDAEFTLWNGLMSKRGAQVARNLDRLTTHPARSSDRALVRVGAQGLDADQAHRDLAEIETLPVTEATRLIRDHVELENARRKAAEGRRPHGRSAAHNSETSPSAHGGTA